MQKKKISKKEIILTGPARDFESIKKINKEGIEYWEARELMPLLGYKEWRKFEGAIAKAKEACKASDQKNEDHFVGAAKMIILAKGTVREAIRNEFFSLCKREMSCRTEGFLLNT
jgi:DNA-damage-inducible protein D